MICDSCGNKGAKVKHVSRTYGKGKNMVVIDNVPIVVCPSCGHESHIFSHGGARLEAEKLGVEFLGELPLDIEIRETSDSGRPIVVSRPDSPHAKTFVAMAERIRDKVTAQDGTRRQAPKIVMQ